jgi:hypothetical protein
MASYSIDFLGLLGSITYRRMGVGLKKYSVLFEKLVVILTHIVLLLEKWP